MERIEVVFPSEIRTIENQIRIDAKKFDLLLLDFLIDFMISFPKKVIKLDVIYLSKHV